MADFILLVILLIIIGGATCYILKAKKNGVKCIGCPSEGTCTHGSGGMSGCGCNCANEKKKCL